MIKKINIISGALLLHSSASGAMMKLPTSMLFGRVSPQTRGIVFCTKMQTKHRYDLEREREQFLQARAAEQEAMKRASLEIFKFELLQAADFVSKRREKITDNKMSARAAALYASNDHATTQE